MKHCEGIGPTPKNPWIFRCLFFCCYKPRRSPPWLGHVQPHPGITCRCGRTRCELGFTHTHTWWPGLRHRPKNADLWWNGEGFFNLRMWVFKGVTGFPPLKPDLSFIKFIHSETCFLILPNTKHTNLPLGLFFFFFLKILDIFYLSNRKIHSFDAWDLLRGVFLPQVWCWNWNP